MRQTPRRDLLHGSRRALPALLATTALAGAAALAPDPARAQTLWTGAASSNWFTAGNWNPAAVPGAGTSVQINTVAPNATVVGAVGAQAAQLTLGNAGGQTGSLTVTGAGSTLSMTSAVGLFLVGNFGTGTLTVSDGATLSSFTTALGNDVGSDGTATVTGAGSIWNLNPIFAFHVGSSSTGTLEILDGGRVNSAGGMDIGGSPGGNGQVLVSGTNSRLALTASGNVGLASQGTLTAQSGGTVTASNLNVGAAAAGTATFDGAGTTATFTGALRVGQNAGGDGTLNIRAGAVVTSNSAQIGTGTGAAGIATVTGTNSRWTVTNALTIGQAANSGAGELHVLAGGRVDASAFTGFNSARVTVDGTGSQFNLLGASATTFTLGGTGANNRLDVGGGGMLATRNANFSTVAGSGVAVAVSGTGTTFNATRIDVGGAGTSSFAVSGGAAVNVTTGTTPSFIVNGANASLTIASGGSVTQGDFVANSGTFQVAESTGGTLRIESGGQLTSRFSGVGELAGAAGTATVTGAGSLWSNRGLIVAFDGTASLDITNGGAVANLGSSTIAFRAGSVGSVLVSGPGSRWTFTQPPPLSGISNLKVGLGGTATMRVDNGAVVTAQGIGVGAAHYDFLGTGNLQPGTGTLVATGAGTRLDVNVATFQSFDAGGDGGTGTIEILDGAVVTVVGQGHFGQSAIFTGATPQQLLGRGTLTVDGAGSRVTYTQTLDIGEQATGILNIRNGGFVSNSDGYLGSFVNAVGSAGVGTATVTGAGSTWQNSGFLRVGDRGTGTLNILNGGAVTNTDAVIGNAAGSTGMVTVSGAGSTWTSTGSLTVGNLGTAILALSDGGAVSAAGPVTVGALGTVLLGNGAAIGTLTAPSLVNNGQIRFDHTGAVTFAIPISGTGSLVKNGPGTTVLTAVSTYSGATTVNAGTLLVNGAIAASPVTVNNSALLGGSGTVGGITANAGAMLAPGNSIGTLNVAGNVTIQAGALYQVEIDDAGRSDRIAATGSATLNGGTVQVVAAPGNYAAGTTYTILSAAGGVAGTFANLTHDLVFLTPVLTYDSDEVFLSLMRNGTAFASVARTFNQRAVAGALDQSPAAATLVQAVLPLTATQSLQAFDQLSGEVHASTAGALLDESRHLRHAVLGRLRTAPATGTGLAPLQAGGPTLAFAQDGPAAPARHAPPRHDGLVFWAHAVGAWANVDADGNAAGLRRKLAAAFTGLDMRMAGGWRAGFAAGYGASTITTDGRGSAGIDTAHLAAYIGGHAGPLALRAGAAVSLHAIATDRTVALPALFDRAEARYDGSTGQLFGEIAYGFGLGRAAIEPFAGLAWVQVRTDGFREGGGSAALAVAANTESTGYSSLGLRVAGAYELGHGMALVPRAAVTWQHAFADPTPTTAHAFLSTGAGFGIRGVPFARDSAVLDAGLDWLMSGRATLGIAYSGQFAGTAEDHAVNARFNWRF